MEKIFFAFLDGKFPKIRDFFYWKASLSDAHDIIGIKTYELDTNPGVPKEERPHIIPEAPDVEIKMHQQQKPPEESASWSGTKKFFIGLVITLALVAIAVIAIMIYQNQQENNRKRFY